MSLSRREFLASLAALGVVGRKIFAAVVEKGVPSYWATSIAAAAQRVDANARTCSFGFWFLTDPHMTANSLHSGSLLAELATQTPLKRVLCGGDIPEAFGFRFPTDRACVDEAIALYNESIVQPIESAGHPFYPAKGNHDFTVRHDPKTAEGFTYDEKMAREILLKGRSAKDIVTNPDDPTACYYYFDDCAAKFRVIVADTTDSNDPKKPYWAVACSMGRTQLDWLARVAFATVPSDYSVVVMHHIPVYTVVGSDEKIASPVYAPFRQLLEAYQNRRVWSANGTRVDFSQAKGRIVLDLTGHEHAERLTFHDGILHVTNPTDARYANYITESSPWAPPLPRKERRTPFEHTFDAVQFDCSRNLVRFTRVGGGADRVIRLEPLRIKVGQTLRFTPELISDADFFGGYDADHIEFLPNPKNKYSPFPKYFSKYATVSADGLVTGLEKGEYVVLARNKDGLREYASVIVC